MSKLYIKEKMRNLDEHYTHPSYALEKKLVNEIKLGLLNDAIDTLNMINSIDRAVLSKDPIRSLKNSMIASCTLFARAIIESNVNSEDVFSLSDVFIMHIESLSSKEELVQFEYKMVKEYIDLLIKSRTMYYSKPITQIITYINEHLTQSITVNDLAVITNRSPDYISRLFKKEVGERLIHYIQKQKIEMSKNFLEFSTMKIAEISELFDFCNPGYYANVFKKHTGLKPEVFRVQRR